MIKLPVDEAYAFDYLSILEVKKNRINSPETQKTFEDCRSSLINQIGNLCLEILLSEEYSLLLDSNSKTFDAVDMARYGNISAKEVDSLNMERYRRKINLQKKFFPRSSLKEIKT